MPKVHTSSHLSAKKISPKNGSSSAYWHEQVKSDNAMVVSREEFSHGITVSKLDHAENSKSFSAIMDKRGRIVIK